jgi:hypothetical protein
MNNINHDITNFKAQTSLPIKILISYFHLFMWFRIVLLSFSKPVSGPRNRK